MVGNSYSMQGNVGALGGENLSGGSYDLGAGLIFAEMANTPSAPALSNDSSWYNKLKVTINTAENSSDATYAVAISDDNWSTTEWVQDDYTVGADLGIEDFENYTGIGGTAYIIGLVKSTGYRVKAKARHGVYTESPLSASSAEASTVNITLSFDLDISASDEETAGPYSVAFGELTAGSVNTAANKVWVDLVTNAEMGGVVFVYDQNAGLKSTVSNYTINAVSDNLTNLTEGFGLKGSSAAGGLSLVSPYNGSDENVGIVNTTIREIFSSGNDPVAAGRGSIFLKAKPSVTTPSANDYADTLTIIAAASF